MIDSEKSGLQKIWVAGRSLGYIENSLILRIIASVVICAPAFAQPAPLAARISVVVAPDSSIGPLRGTLELVTNPEGTTRTHRIVWAAARRVYFGYDLLVEPIQGAEYRAAFLPLDTQDTTGLRFLKDWTSAPRTALPSPQKVHPGDRIALSLSPGLDDSLDFELAPSGEPSAERRGLFEQVKQVTSSPFEPLPPAAPRTLTQTVEGPVRDFSAGDASIRIWHPQIRVNGVAGRSSIAIATTSLLPWVYLPRRGRFILSLLPLPNAGFSLAGESRGSAIRLKVGQDTLELQSVVEFAPGGFAYNLYVLAESDWIPTSRSQRDRPLLGTVDLAELSHR